MSYRQIAKDFGLHFNIGKWGVKFLPTNPSGKIYKLVQIIPLDGWITDPVEVEHIMRERGLEL